MDFIKDTIIYNKKLKSQNIFNIVFVIDNDFVRPMGVLMTSILLNNPAEQISFHIITKFISKSEKQSLKNFSSINNVEIYIYIIDDNFFANLPVTSYISQAMYNRFLIPLILKNTTSTVLYLDSDIICLNSIAKLKTIDITNKIVAVTEESNTYVVQQQINKLNLKNNKYFNSGMLYINIKKWIQNDITNKLLTASKEYNNLLFPDQDLLNIVLENDCKYIDNIFNYTFDVRYKPNRYIYTIPDNTVFLHYVGRFKPWQEWCMHPLREKFREIAKMSLWKNIPWDKPKTYKQMKNMAKSYWIYDQKIKSLFWYLKYSVYKIKSKL